MLNPQNRNTSLEREEGKDRSSRAHPCLSEDRKIVELFELLP